MLWRQGRAAHRAQQICDGLARSRHARGTDGGTVAAPAFSQIMQQALEAPGPVIIEVVVDPNEPPLPPKIMPEQAIHFAEAMVRGEPNREKLALTVLSETVRELI